MYGLTTSLKYQQQQPEINQANDQPFLLPILEDGSSSEEEFYQSRITAISEIVQSKGLSLDSEVSYDDVLNILDTIGGTSFDREIADQLFQKIPKKECRFVGDNAYFQLKHFVDTYIRAEYLLILQIKETHQEILNHNEEIRQTQESLDNALRTEVLNQYNLSINSSLYINVIEAVADSKQFVPNPNAVYTTTAICNKYKYESEEIKIGSNSDFNPKFEWDFHIKIETGDEKVVLSLREIDAKNKNNPILRSWKTTFTVQSYLDQIEHETWLKLYDDKNNYSKLQLHCIIQFRFSEAKFFQDSLKSLTEIRDKLLENKSILENSLLNLVAPFIPQPADQEEQIQNGYY